MWDGTMRQQQAYKDSVKALSKGQADPLTVWERTERKESLRKPSSGWKSAQNKVRGDAAVRREGAKLAARKMKEKEAAFLSGRVRDHANINHTHVGN